MKDGVDVDRIADMAEGLGLVTPDMQGPGDELDEVVVIIHIRGGLVAEVGASEVARLRVVIVDDDVLDDGESGGVWTETVSEFRSWSRDGNAALVRAAGELPEDLRRRLDLPEPTTRPTEDDRVPPCPTETPGEE